MLDEKKSHPAVVDRWLKTLDDAQFPEPLLDRYQHAVQELWNCAHETLSEITLRAIFERVLHNAAERYAIMTPASVNDEGVSFCDLKPAPGQERELSEAFRFIIVEFLAIAGSMTDQVITPALHARLSKLSYQKKDMK